MDTVEVTWPGGDKQVVKNVTTNQHITITEGAITECERPTGNQATNVTFDAAAIIWNPVPGADRYQLQYRPLGTTNVNTDVTASLFRSLNGLLPGTVYQYRVRANCPGIGRGPFKFGNFITATPKLQHNDVLTIYPNPANSKLNLGFFSRKSGLATLAIFDVIGRKYVENDINTEIGFNSKTINVAALNAGFYTIELKMNGGGVMTGSFLIER